MKKRLVLLSVLLGLFTFETFAQKKLVILGSSTAYGIGASVYDSAWAGRLQAAYRKNLSDADTVVSNLALGGFTTYQAMPSDFVPPAGRPAPDVTRNVTRAIALAPDVAIISMPSNDIANGFTKQEYMYNLRLMYQRLTAAGIKTYVTTTQPRDFLPNTTMMQYQRDLVDSINATFGSNAIDFWTLIADANYNQRVEYRYGDGIHLNDRGHAVLFQQVWNKQIFGQPSVKSSGPTSFTQRVEAENYTAMYGVQKEVTLDAGGGLDVGWIDNGDWMDFSVTVPAAGMYTLDLRIATPNTGAQLRVLKSDGSSLSSAELVNTGGYQNWQTVSTSLTLAAGTQTIRIQSASAAMWNINWIELTTSTAPAPVITSISNRYEAENYTGMYGVQKEVTLDAGGGQDVGWIDNGDWMDFTVNAPSAGMYTVNLRVATPNNGAQLQIKKADGTLLGTANLSNTGGYQNWQTTSVAVNLAAGQQTIRIQSSSISLWNINWFELNYTSSAPTPAPAPPPAPAPSNLYLKLEAENYTSMSGVQKEVTLDAGGGEDIGWIDNADWMDYSVTSPSAGTYTVNLRIATPNTGAQLQIRKEDGTILSFVAIPNTGGYQNWQTVSTKIELSGGKQTIRIISIAAPGWNINWLELVGGSSTTTTVPTTPVASTTTRVEAENYTNMLGVQKEVTLDAGGGQDVGWIDNGDWMDFSYNAPVAGTYTINFRVATPNNGAQLQVKSAAGTVLGTLNLPNTGGYQNWQTASVTVTLAAGQQTLRVASTTANMWNINWLELVSPGSASAKLASTSVVSETSLSAGAALELYPNPVSDRFTLTVNNNLTGKVQVDLISSTGVVVKQFSLSKAAAGTTQFYLSIGTLPAGTYVLKASMTNWSDSKNLIKQ